MNEVRIIFFRMISALAGVVMLFCGCCLDSENPWPFLIVFCICGAWLSIRYFDVYGWRDEDDFFEHPDK